MDDLRQGILEIFAEAGQTTHDFEWAELVGQGHDRHATWVKGLRSRALRPNEPNAYGRAFGPGWYAKLSEEEKVIERAKERDRKARRSAHGR